MNQPQSDQPAGRVTHLRFEHLTETLGIGADRPRLSWWVETQAAPWQQSAYEIEARTPSGDLQGQTGQVVSSQSVLVDWPFEPLCSRQQVTVRVRAWGTDGQPTDWSEPARLEAGLLAEQDWSAQFISPNLPPSAQGAPLLRTEFELGAPIRQARLYISALGVYEAYLNGQPVGDHVMAPGWTSYSHRLRYQTFDVTDLLREGGNALGAMLGSGWFCGRLGFGGGRANLYGSQLALLAQLEVDYQDGSTVRIVTDESWRAAAGPILADDIYDGETYDARNEIPGWNEPGLDDRAWSGVQNVQWDLATLFASLGPPVRRTLLIEPLSIHTSPGGQTIVDFGQNLVGRVRIRVQGPAGQVITLQHAEVLENGELALRPLRHAKATDQYILKGEGIETYEPRFTFHGFRYAGVTGWPGELQSGDLLAVVCHSDMERTGWFDCSDPLLNRMHENALWSMRGNFLDIPTDCPQRDERLGWTGDIQVFSPTASYLYDVAGFLTSWLRDLAFEQQDYGVVPFVVPNVLPNKTPPVTAWGDSAVMIPWVLYQRFGDVKVLADQFDSMKAWVDLIDRTAGENRLWDTGFQFGDWLDPSAPPDNPADARTPGFLIASAYFARSAELVGLSAGLLGHQSEADHYLKLADEVRAAFNREYVTPAGRVLSDSATAYALVLQFDLLETAEQRRRAGERLAELARANRYRISTGFVGTPLICDALCSVGLEDTAFRLLMERECPSWLYPVTMGATTIWERWDSLLPDGSINPGEMTSFNHYALGAVADWVHRTIGGLAALEPGYRKLAIQPIPAPGLTFARAEHITPYGPAACFWKIADGQMQVEVELPPNTSARVTLPGQSTNEAVEVGSGKHAWSVPFTPQRVHLSLDSTVAEVIEDAQALPAVRAALRSFSPKVASRVLAQPDEPLREAAAGLDAEDEILASLQDALDALNANG